MRVTLISVPFIKPPLFNGTSLFLLLSLKRTGCFPFLLSFLLVLPKSVLFLIQMWLMKEALVEITTAVTVCLGMPIISSYRQRH